MTGPVRELEVNALAHAAPHDNSEESWSLGVEIGALRKVKGMTLIAFSERTGKSIGYVSQVERDITEPSHVMLQTISSALGVQIGWFYPADGNADLRERRYVVYKTAGAVWPIAIFVESKRDYYDSDDGMAKFTRYDTPHKPS